jgi:hypothetical protein
MRDPRATDEARAALRAVTRRHFFRESALGVGSLALASLLDERLFAAPATGAVDPLAVRPPHFAPKAKRLVYLFMAGAPSQVDLLDPKPALQKHDGQPIPEELVKGERFAFIKGTPRLLGSPYTFEKCGQAGIEVSSLLPRFRTIVDEVALLRTVHTTQFNHAPAQIFMNTGLQIVGRPSMGAWLTYGLGSENRDLPGFVVLVSGENAPDGGKSCWGSGFLPTVYQGVELRNQGDPVLFLTDPAGVDRAARRDALDVLRALNERRLAESGDAEIATRVASYELAYRMQTSVPELVDIAKEPPAVHEAYGTEPGKVSFANNCLLARRLLERGTRFVQLYHRGWDHHGTGKGDDIVNRLPKLCREVDQAMAALVLDLKQRGMLDDTLVVWGGEFGRTPMNEGRNDSKFLGRDHHQRAFSMWLAGGGVKKGAVVGATDELGYNPVEDPVDVHDLHATILHLMGLEHTKLTYRFQGRDFRLTDVSGNVVTKLVA